MSDVSDLAAQRATERWLEQIVVGMNLCPFAAAPLHHRRVRFVVSSANGEEPIYRDFLQLLEQFVASEASEWETALLIFSRGLSEFDEYLDMLASMDDAIDAAGLRGVIQLASFHPNYCFDQAPLDDAANYSNRSPYPMVHLLREAGLSAALESYLDPEQIPQRNVHRLRRLGLAAMQQRLAACYDND